LAPTPENYRLWYHHLRSENPELSRAIERLLEEPELLNEERCAELYERFFGNGREERVALQGCRRLYELAQSLLEQAGSAGRDTQRYGTALHDAQAAMAPAAGSPAPRR
jgi:diguanylate cyclase